MANGGIPRLSFVGCITSIPAWIGGFFGAILGSATTIAVAIFSNPESLKTIEARYDASQNIVSVKAEMPRRLENDELYTRKFVLLNNTNELISVSSIDVEVYKERTKLINSQKDYFNPKTFPTSCHVASNKDKEGIYSCWDSAVPAKASRIIYKGVARHKGDEKTLYCGNIHENITFNTNKGPYSTNQSYWVECQ